MRQEKRVENAVINLSQMVIENSRIIGRFVALYEVLKDKGIIKDEDIIAKIKSLEEKREEDAKRKLEEERKRLIAEQEAKHNGNQESLKSDPIQP